MKRFLLFFATLLTGLMFYACGGDEIEEPTTPPSISVSTINFTNEGGSQRFSVSGAESVSLPSSSSWYTFDFVSAMNGTTYIKVTVQPNETYEVRTATVTIVADGTNLQLTVNQEASPMPVQDTDAFKMGQASGLGWNLGNNMDGVNTWSYNGKVVAEETAWGNAAATEETFKGLAAKGIKCVRIPVTWEGHVGDAPDYTIDDKWLGRVAELVGWAKANGLKAMINIHHDEGAGAGHYGFLDIKTAAYDKATNDAVKARLKAMWIQIAEKFKNEGDYLIFESMNEVQDGGWGWTNGANGNLGDGGKQYATLNEWQQVFVDAVRSTGGENAKRWLAVVGYAQSPDLTMKELVLPSDPTPNRLMVGVHCYEPFEYCTNATINQWGHTSTVASTKNGEKTISTLIENLKKKYVEQNIPVYVGEMGSVNREAEKDRKFQQYYMEYFARCCYLNGIACYIWDNGVKNKYGQECFGYIDHGTGEYIGYAQSIIEAMVKATTSTDENYNLESIYATAP